MRMMILTEQDKAEFIRRVSAMPVGEKRWVAEFKQYKVQRSIKQCRLYHLWLRCIKDDTGNSEEDMDSYFKQKFLSWDTKMVCGEEVAVAIHTTNLDTAQFTVYLDKIQQWSLEQGIFLPQPSQYGWDEFFANYGID